MQTTEPSRPAPPSSPVATGSAPLRPSPMIHTITADCRECGKLFRYPAPHPAASSLLSGLHPRVCAACAPVIEARYARQEAERETAELQAARGERWRKVCPPLYRDTDRDRLPPGGLTAVDHWPFGPQGLGFVGDSGRGKTRTMMLLLRRMLMEHGRSCSYVTSASFSHEVSRRAGSGKPGDLDDYLAWLCRADLWFLDDIGKGRLTDRVESELYHVIETRTANLRPILFTSNASGQALADSMSEDRGTPIIRRLREFCEVVVL